jgi:branched-chain amino acid transport system permease protein
MSELLDILALSVKSLVSQSAVFFALMGVGLNLHFGYTGLLNFGQIGFALLGGYGVAISVAMWGLPLLVGVLIGVFAAFVLALLLGLPTLRLRADYLAIVTIAAAEILRLVFRATPSTPVTGATRGLSGFGGEFYDRAPFETQRTYEFLGSTWTGREIWAVLIGWILVTLFSLLIWQLMRSPWGRVLKAIREDEDAVRSLGKNVYSYKMQSLILGGIMASFGGMILVLSTGSANPDQFQNANTFLAYAALILGGTARVLGPVIGSMLLWFLIAFTDAGLAALIRNGIIPDEILSRPDVANIRFVLVGVGLMLLLIFRPQGILGDRREVMLDAR